MNTYRFSGINFKVIGIYSDPAGGRDEDKVFVPFTTGQSVFNGADHLQNLAFTMKPEKNFEKAVKAANQFSDEIKQYLK